ncbi:hypothetical protein CALCODRAFT_513042 [Calocera cornea HHB12733]|uniref:Uncharacterized protein n=1 Tax=Calocera cornea HHB12733 TaxID=1353952 RepID=A0A165CIQ8_9BASI|nr:hypothetical protein CALCODRAFT_513042 [Calocera cornea HHB12733]
MSSAATPRLEEWTLPSTFDDVFFKWLSVSTAQDMHQKLDFIMRSNLLEHRKDLKQAYQFILLPAIFSKINNTSDRPRLYQLVPITNHTAPDAGIPLSDPSQAATKRLVSVLVSVTPDMQFIVADAINTLIQIFAFLVNVADDAQARDRMILCYHLASLVFDPKDMPQVWSSATFLAGESNTHLLSGLRNSLSGCTLPGAWAEWAVAKDSIIAYRREELERLIGPQAFARLRTIEEQIRKVNDGSASPPSKAKIANCAETIIFFWLGRTVNREDASSILDGLTVRLISIDKTNLPDLIKNLKKDLAKFSAQGLRESLAIRLSPPVPNQKPRRVGIRWAIGPCWRCRMLGAFLYEHAAQKSVRLSIEFLKGTGAAWMQWDTPTVPDLLTNDPSVLVAPQWSFQQFFQQVEISPDSIQSVKRIGVYSFHEFRVWRLVPWYLSLSWSSSKSSSTRSARYRGGFDPCTDQTVSLHGPSDSAARRIRSFSIPNPFRMIDNGPRVQSSSSASITTKSSPTSQSPFVQ